MTLTKRRKLTSIYTINKIRAYCKQGIDSITYRAKNTNSAKNIDTINICNSFFNKYNFKFTISLFVTLLIALCEKLSL